MEISRYFGVTLFFMVILFLMLNPTIILAKPVYMECKDKGNGRFSCQLDIERIKYGEQAKVLSLHGTEYHPNENATIFLQLLIDGQPQNNASCQLTMYYPDKSVLLNKVLMFHLPGSDGLYYFDLITPSMTGVYMLSVQCFYVVNYNYDYADNAIVTYGLESGTYQDTWKDDNVFHSITEKVVGGYRMEVEYDFYNITIPNNATSVGINWIGRWNDPSESIFVAIYNYCNMTWENCSTQITTNTPMYSCVLEGNVSCYINDSTSRVMFRDYDPTEKEEAGVFDTDFLEFKTLYLTYGQIDNIRGSGEVHVNPVLQACVDANYTINDVRSRLIDINNTVQNILANQIAYFPIWNVTFYYWNNSYFVNWNGSIMNLNNNWQNLWNLWNCTVANEVCRYLVAINYTVSNIEINNTGIAEAVWNFYNRTLTDYNQTDIMNLLYAIQNNQVIYFPTWNLTFYYWNTTTFVSFNNKLINLESDFDTLWNELNCSNYSTLLCDYLAEINSTVSDNNVMAYDIRDRLIDMNNTIQSILANQVAYFPTWNSTFYYWNNTLFVSFNNKLTNLENNFNTLWNELNCSNYSTKLCQFLAEINTTSHNISGDINNINATINAILNNQAIYFPIWNATFYYWNNTLLVRIDNKLTNLDNNFSQLWNELNCTNYSTLLCDFLTSINNSNNDIVNRLIDMNNTIQSILANQINYFPIWNTTFHFWNSTYFAVWNNHIINLNSNWQKLWNLWNCTISNEVCQYLSAINYTVSNININNTAIAEAVWQYSTRTLTDYNQSTILSLLYAIRDNQTAYFPIWNSMFFIWNNSYFVLWNNSIVSLDGNWQNLWNLWNCTVANEVCVYLSTINYTINNIINETEIAKVVWSYTTRTLTDYNQSSILAYLVEINSSIYFIPSNVWNFTNRTLTDYNQTDIIGYLVEINGTTHTILLLLLDTAPPTITIYSPTNTTYNVNTIYLKYTAVDPNLDSCWYSLDGGNNIILVNCQNITISFLSNGQHNITVYANDTYGNVNSHTVYFTILVEKYGGGIVTSPYIESENISVQLYLDECITAKISLFTNYASWVKIRPIFEKAKVSIWNGYGWGNESKFFLNYKNNTIRLRMCGVEEGYETGFIEIKRIGVKRPINETQYIKIGVNVSKSPEREIVGNIIVEISKNIPAILLVFISILVIIYIALTLKEKLKGEEEWEVEEETTRWSP